MLKSEQQKQRNNCFRRFNVFSFIFTFYFFSWCASWSQWYFNEQHPKYMYKIHVQIYITGIIFINNIFNSSFLSYYIKVTWKEWKARDLVVNWTKLVCSYLHYTMLYYTWLQYHYWEWCLLPFACLHIE